VTQIKHVKSKHSKVSRKRIEGKNEKKKEIEKEKEIVI
jgi:hypothetical protein